ncbi:MAG TPA: hypothetical protein VMH00_07510 [Candidatus Limnocylindrales bacterium]|nr:hypothetical protein [Candidatus Limnocylindrales bacterium]
MPFRFEFDSQNQILACRFRGRVTDEVLLDYYRDSGPRLMATMSFRASLLDFSDVTSFEVSPETIRGIAWAPPIDPEPERTRVIIAPSSKVFGLARMFALHGEDTRPNLHVVRKLEEAYALLGIIEPHFEPLPDSD